MKKLGFLLFICFSVVLTYWFSSQNKIAKDETIVKKIIAHPRPKTQSIGETAAPIVIDLEKIEKVGIEKDRLERILNADPDYRAIGESNFAGSIDYSQFQGREKEVFRKSQVLFSVLNLCLINRRCGIDENNKNFDPDENVVTEEMEKILSVMSYLSFYDRNVEVNSDSIFRVFEIDNVFLIEKAASLLLSAVKSEKEFVEAFKQARRIKGDSMESFLNVFGAKYFLSKYNLKKEYQELLYELSLDADFVTIDAMLRHIKSSKVSVTEVEDLLQSICKRKDFRKKKQTLRTLKVQINSFKEMFPDIDIRNCR